MELANGDILAEGLLCLLSVEPEATEELLKAGFSALDDNEFALLSSTGTLLRQLEILASRDTAARRFSQLQIITAFRNICTLLKIRLKQVTGATALFYDVLQTGYRKNLAVWARFEAEKNHCGMSSRSETPYAMRLRYALSPYSSPASHRERFADSLLVAYIVRNYAAHDMDISGPLVEPLLTRTILRHLLNVFTNCDAEKSL
jgi:hypothetical protein